MGVTKFLKYGTHTFNTAKYLKDAMVPKIKLIVFLYVCPLDIARHVFSFNSL